MHLSIASIGDVNSLESLKNMNDLTKFRSQVIGPQLMVHLPRIHAAPGQAEEEENS